jgi:hypothetical protein
MTQRLLRHIPTGILYAYQDIYAIRPDFEEIIDVESRVVEEPAAEAPVKKTRAKKADTTSVDAELNEATGE